MRIKKMDIPKYRILSIDAKELYELDLVKNSFNIYNNKGEVERTRFNSYLYNSLEVIALKNEYERAKAQRKIKDKFCFHTFKVGNEESEATLSVINVTFEKDFLEFNRKKSHKGYVYLRAGHRIDFSTDLVDNVCIRDGKLIAIVVPYTSKDEYKIGNDEYQYKPVENPCDASLFDGFFTYDEELKCYLRTKKRFSVKCDKSKLREHLYENGFTIDVKEPIHYKRYKRSAGSSRQGNCLFIAEPLYKGMMKWSSCGLDLSKAVDQISKESYISLTLSNMEKEINIPANAIVVLPDAKSIFDDTVVSVNTVLDDGVSASEASVSVENKIWDGQALLDESVFAENGYESKGMMLLRNRFFKTCAFNTKLQAWLKDRGIKDISDLNQHAITRAKSIEDIKLVVTDSSIKYIKLYDGSREDAINAWLDSLNISFGLVKTEKETKHMDGKMVQTSYQLLNTLELSDDEVKELLTDSLDYLWKIQSDPMYMRHFIKMQLREDKFKSESLFDECEDVYDGDNYSSEADTANEMRKNVVMNLLTYNDRFAYTDEYAEFRTQTKKSIIRDLRKGHILVNGTNATLFGNGYEMLYALTSKDYDLMNPSRKCLEKGHIRISRFENGKELLCARSPHITMGNLYVCQNSISDKDVYSRYFNLTNEIVCINSIEENLLQRLNGCDFDSDAMLVTDNEIMLRSAKKNYGKFLVPYCSAKPTIKKGDIHLANMDNEISNNKIGEIVNLSQWLNSIYWDKHSRGEDDKELYLEICKLAVLSGMEIDRAKRDYGVKSSDILQRIRNKSTKNSDGIALNKPQFFKYSKKSDSKSNPKYDDTVETSMQKVVNAIKTEVHKSPRRKSDEMTTLSQLLPEFNGEIKDNDYRYRKQIIEELNKSQTKLSAIRSMMHLVSDREKTAKMSECKDIENKCVAYVKRMMKSLGVLYLLVKALDDKDSDAQSCRSLLLSSICSASDDFYRLIANTRDTMYQLEPDKDGDIQIYGYNHSKRAIK